MTRLSDKVGRAAGHCLSRLWRSTDGARRHIDSLLDAFRPGHFCERAKALKVFEQPSGENKVTGLEGASDDVNRPATVVKGNTLSEGAIKITIAPEFNNPACKNLFLEVHSNTLPSPDGLWARLARIFTRARGRS